MKTFQIWSTAGPQDTRTELVAFTSEVYEEDSPVFKNILKMHSQIESFKNKDCALRANNRSSVIAFVFRDSFRVIKPNRTSFEDRFSIELTVPGTDSTEPGAWLTKITMDLSF